MSMDSSPISAPEFRQRPAQPATPMDELTGLPLLLYPYDEADELFDLHKHQLVLRNTGCDYADMNHAFHPRTARELNSDDGKPIRQSRGQLVRRSDHDNYHKAYYGPRLPKTSDERFKCLVFCTAGYIPRLALDLRGNSPDGVRTLSDNQIIRLRNSGEVHWMQHDSIIKFLEKYVLDKPELAHIRPKLIDEFLTMPSDNSYDERRKRFLTHRLLSLVIDPATLPLHDTYRQTVEDNLWGPSAGPRQIVHDELLGNSVHRRERSIDRIGKTLAEKFAIYRDMAPVA